MKKIIKTIVLMFLIILSGCLIAPHVRDRLNQKRDTSFGGLVKQSDCFTQHVRLLPTSHNRICVIAKENKRKQRIIERHAAQVRPIAHESVKALVDDFLAYKCKWGSTIEKNLYAQVSASAFIDRLLRQRPLMFMNPSDDYLLRDGKTKGHGGFDAIGTLHEKDPLTLANYISYDEMSIAALLGVSTPTYFINDGNRNNRAKVGNDGSYQEEGVYVGLVGARFERPGLMEWRHMMITPDQNTVENGYGQTPKKGRRADFLALWARFYDVPYFYTYQEAQVDRSGRFLKLHNGYFLDIFLYKRRLEKVLIPFLADADARGKSENKKVYCHAVGLGTGVWAVSPRQEEFMLQVYADLLKKHKFCHISDVDFSWFGPQGLEGMTNDSVLNACENTIKIHFSKRNPADPLIDENEGKLLVAMYAWDGNAYPGNEYWVGALTASGDPAAACCSTIAELQNPLINPWVTGSAIKYYE